MFLPDFVCLFVCLSVCQQDNSKSYGWIFLELSGNVGNGKNYQWFNFGGDLKGILDHFEVFVNTAFLMETAAKPNMVLPPGEQHGLGGGLRALTAF